MVCISSGQPIYTHPHNYYYIAVVVFPAAQCCVRLQHLELLHGPSLNSSAVAELCRGESFSSLRSLTLTFTPTSPKAIHCLLGELLIITQWNLCDPDP